MGKYSNINARSLLNAASNAISELSSHNLNTEYNNLRNQNTLTSQASEIVCNSLNNIINSKSINGSINKLKDKLNNLKKAAEYIQKCQDLEKEINALEKRLYDSDGKKNVFVQMQINSDKRSLTSYENKVDSLLS